MSSSSRREAIRKGATAALGAVCAFNAQTVFAQGRGHAAPTQGSMRLTRRVWRQLVDGKDLVVERSWGVEFTPRGQGWHVAGSQIAVKVDAPAALAELARMEQARQVDEAFPIVLDASGFIVQNSFAKSDLNIEHIGKAAQLSIARLGGDASDRRQLGLLLSHIQQASISAMTRFPQDLFFPQDGELSESKVMDLPGGLTGRLELTYRASANPQNGLLKRSERTVVTQIEGEELRSSEFWQLESF